MEVVLVGEEMLEVVVVEMVFMEEVVEPGGGFH